MARTVEVVAGAVLLASFAGAIEAGAAVDEHVRVPAARRAEAAVASARSSSAPSASAGVSRSDGQPCSLQWGREHPWCIGARARHVVVSLSPYMDAWITIYAGERPSSKAIFESGRIESGAAAARWESPTLTPGPYYVRTSTFSHPSPGIQPIYSLEKVVRVPIPQMKRARPAP